MILLFLPSALVYHDANRAHREEASCVTFLQPRYAHSVLQLAQKTHSLPLTTELGVGPGPPKSKRPAWRSWGYAGISYQDEVDLDARLAAFDARGLKIFNVYVPCHVDLGARVQRGPRGGCHAAQGHGRGSLAHGAGQGAGRCEGGESDSRDCRFRGRLRSACWCSTPMRASTWRRWTMRCGWWSRSSGIMWA